MRHDQALVALPVIFPVVFVHFIQFHNPEQPYTDEGFGADLILRARWSGSGAKLLEDPRLTHRPTDRVALLPLSRGHAPSALSLARRRGCGFSLARRVCRCLTRPLIGCWKWQSTDRPLLRAVHSVCMEWCHERMIAVFLPFSLRLHMIFWGKTTEKLKTR